MRGLPDNFAELDLGCGENKHAGAVGVDSAEMPGVDIVHDLADIPYPFASSSAGRIYLTQVLDHFDFNRRLDVLREIHRILQPGGILELSVMHSQCLGYLQDPTHKSTFSFKSMDYFREDFYWHYYAALDFSFDILKRRANVELGLKRLLGNGPALFLNRLAGNILTGSARFSGALGDYLIRMLPFYWVEISWVLRKPARNPEER